MTKAHLIQRISVMLLRCLSAFRVPAPIGSTMRSGKHRAADSRVHDLPVFRDELFNIVEMIDPTIDP
ncbi:hypothetical protein IEQ11_01310 [Lysobacter capsici]|uniref:hypothetical protein n=1 Tax=Lysobacter capsici TaxID=435897 RepID=UPI0017823CC0|nr:hypothetical protein [Lysobacter capsici]UOF15334.1 hypothetical protein IEQ11_01310 [Lysobacter capsici]